MSDDLTVELRRVAWFGKPAEGLDYTWVTEGDAPGELVVTVGLLAQVCAVQRARGGFVWRHTGKVWLGRIVSMGLDHVGREIVGADLSEVLNPPAQHTWPVLVWTARLVPSERAKSWKLSIPLLDVPKAEAPPSARIKAAAGNPLSVDSKAARWLLRHDPVAHLGVCIVDREVPWVPELASLLCISFSDAPNDDGLDGAIPILCMPEAWAALGRLTVPMRRLALGWFAGGAVAPAPPALVGDESGRRWLLAVRDIPDPRIRLGQLRRDVEDLSGGRELLRDALTSLMPPEAVASLDLIVAGGSVAADDIALAALLAAGILDIPGIVPLSGWVRLAPQSPALAAAAVARLQLDLQIDASMARFVLNLRREEGDVLGDVESLPALLEKAGLAVPRQRIAEALFRDRDRELALRLEALPRSFNLWVAAVAGLAREQLPPVDILPDEEVVRLLCLAPSPDQGLAERLFAQRAADPAALRSLRDAFRNVAVSLPEELDRVLSVRLGDLPPQPPPSRLVELARAGLVAEPEVNPTSEAELRRCALAWPVHGMLLVFLGESPCGRPVDPPEAWLPCLRRVARHELAARSIASIQDDDFERVRRWVTRILGLPGAPSPEWFDLGRGMAFTLLRGVEVTARLELLEHLTRRGAMDEASAESMVKGLFPFGEEDLELMLHALTQVGPLPSLVRASPRLLCTLLPVLDPLEVIDSLLACARGALPATTVDAVVGRIAESGVVPPRRGYTRRQLERQAPLVARLAHLPGWEHLAPSVEDRVRLARRALSDLEVDPASLVIAPAEPS